MTNCGLRCLSRLSARPERQRPGVRGHVVTDKAVFAQQDTGQGRDPEALETKHVAVVASVATPIPGYLQFDHQTRWNVGWQHVVTALTAGRRAVSKSAQHTANRDACMLQPLSGGEDHDQLGLSFI